MSKIYLAGGLIVALIIGTAVFYFSSGGLNRLQRKNIRPGYAALEVEYLGTLPERQTILAKLNTLNLGPVLIDTIGDNRVVIQTKQISEAEHQRLLAALSDLGKMQETKFNSIGPTKDCPLLIDMSKVSFEIKEDDGSNSAVFTQAYITKGSVETNQFGETALQFELSGPGKTAFADLTEKASNAHEKVALFINGRPVSFPVVMSKIITDKIQVNAGFPGKARAIIGEQNLKLACE